MAGMINQIKVQISTRFKSFIHSGEQRDVVIRKNIIFSLVFQFLSNLLGLAVVPLSLSYIDKEQYGIWINASIMVTWLQNMNFGMGFGMQNKVAEAMANDKPSLAKEYVSIVYRYSTLIALGLLVLGLVASFFINWNTVFNSSKSSSELHSVILIAFICFLIYFVLGNIVPLFDALKQTSIPKFFALLTNLSTLVFLFAISQFSHNNLVYAALALAAPTPIVYLLGTIYFFRKKLTFIRPSWRIRDKTHVGDVFNLGMKFFVMQLTTLVISQSGVFIITQFLGPAEVTPYSIINRYYYFIFFIFMLGIQPYWAGFTEAYVKKDYTWIRRSMRHLFISGFVGAMLVGLMLLLSFSLIPIWSRNSFNIDDYHGLLYSGALYTVTLFFSAIISMFLNALSLLRIQMIVQVVIAMLTISVSIVLLKYFKLGSMAVNLTAILGQLIYIFICGSQVLGLSKLKS